MNAEKEQILQAAPGALNRPDIPWVVTVEGDSIVTRWKWMDALFFAPQEVNNETRDYCFTVSLTDKKTWKERDNTENNSMDISFENGNLSFGTSKEKFAGKTTQKSFSIGIGRDHQSKEVGLIGFKFDTVPLKQSVRNYLASYGWKKAGFFG